MKELSEELLSDVNVLIVDDSEITRIIIRKWLQYVGAQVEESEDGKEAVEKCRANDFKVVLMDIQMPILDGLSATRQIREEGGVMPIIGITAAPAEEFPTMQAAGMNSHFQKPIDMRGLIDLLVSIKQVPVN